MNNIPFALGATETTVRGWFTRGLKRYGRGHVVRIRRAELLLYGQVIELRRAANTEASGGALLQPLLQTRRVSALQGRSSPVLDGNRADSDEVDAEQAGPRVSSAESTVTLSHEAVSQALEDARDRWARSADPRALRMALLALVRQLGDGE